MTPKEKAEELIVKYLHLTKVFNVECGYIDDIDTAKLCALTAVDEIMNMPKIASFRRNEIYMELEYWQEVKQEIENL